jgi:hypothetical protein
VEQIADAPVVLDYEALREAFGEPASLEDAQQAVNEYIRLRMREDGFSRRIIPPIQITNDELDRAVDTDRPVRVVDHHFEDDDWEP